MSDVRVGHFHPPCRSRRPRGGLSNRRPQAASGCPRCYAARAADPVPTSLTESKPHPRGPLYRWRICGNATRSPSTKKSPTASPDAGDPMLTVARSVARAITASHRLLPFPLSAYDRQRARPTRITMEELRRLTRFWRTAPMRNVLSCPTGAANLQSSTVPPSLGLLLGPTRNS